MKLGNLNETVFLIDVDFLNEKISENLTFYQDLYPAKQFIPINLSELILRFVENARINTPGQILDVIFAYSLSGSVLNFCIPSDLTFEIDNLSLSSERGLFQCKAFFADEDESNIMHFIDILEQLFSYKHVKKIVLVADNVELNDEIEMNEYHTFKDLFLIKNSDGTHISLPVHYSNIDCPIAYSLGLNQSEI
jgi:hypothetical protein